MPLGVFILAAIVYAFNVSNSYVKLQDEVHTLHASQLEKFENHDSRIRAQKQWQEDWAEHGQLKEDVRQNEKLAYLKEEVDRCRVKIDALAKR